VRGADLLRRIRILAPFGVTSRLPAAQCLPLSLRLREARRCRRGRRRGGLDPCTVPDLLRLGASTAVGLCGGGRGRQGAERLLGGIAGTPRRKRTCLRRGHRSALETGSNFGLALALRPRFRRVRCREPVVRDQSPRSGSAGVALRPNRPKGRTQPNPDPPGSQVSIDLVTGFNSSRLSDGTLSRLRKQRRISQCS
jgi:hypothetical protein